MTRKVKKATTKKKKTKGLPHKYFTQQEKINDTNRPLLLRSATLYNEPPYYNDHYYQKCPVVNNQSTQSTQTPSNIKELRLAISNNQQASTHIPTERYFRQPKNVSSLLLAKSVEEQKRMKQQQIPSTHSIIPSTH